MKVLFVVNHEEDFLRAKINRLINFLQSAAWISINWIELNCFEAFVWKWNKIQKSPASGWFELNSCEIHQKNCLIDLNLKFWEFWKFFNINQI